MSFPVVLRPEAVDDVISATKWYEREQVGLGDRFAAAVDELLNRIGTMPEVYAIVALGVRRVKVKTFPYVIYYRLLADRVEVIAILHGRQHPDTWQTRV